jgi:hypothetical protein
VSGRGGTRRGRGQDQAAQADKKKTCHCPEHVDRKFLIIKQIEINFSVYSYCTHNFFTTLEAVYSYEKPNKVIFSLES